MDKNSTTKTATTRVFKSGNSQAVRIPVEMAFASNDMEVTVTRCGDVITIRPAMARQSVEQMFAALRALPPASLLPQVDRIELPERDWD
jgi:antitoxin VapB